MVLYGNETLAQMSRKALALAIVLSMAAQPAPAALLNLAQMPLFVGSNIPPKVMLTISKDQQLFKKAYNDYSDLDGDGQIETTYKHSIDYYGYFDPQKCYDYSDRVEPNGASSRRVASSDATDGTVHGQWNGNFLNWVSMSRMDAVRKLLYGGMRSTDQTFAAGGVNAVTVLERAYLPTDAHAWAKYYNPAPGHRAAQPPINPLTPFAGCRTTPAATVARQLVHDTRGDRRLRHHVHDRRMTARSASGDQISMSERRAPPRSVHRRRCCRISNGEQDRERPRRRRGHRWRRLGSASTGRVTNLSSTGHLVLQSDDRARRAAATSARRRTRSRRSSASRKGNFGLWNANERCAVPVVRGAQQLPERLPGRPAQQRQPGRALGDRRERRKSRRAPRMALGTGGAQGEYIARVQVCVSQSLLTAPRNAASAIRAATKPIGLLQEYGDDDRIHFGLMTGSYPKNITGGVLRKNVGAFTDEVDVDTTARSSQTRPVPAAGRAAHDGLGRDAAGHREHAQLHAHLRLRLQPTAATSARAATTAPTSSSTSIETTARAGAIRWRRCSSNRCATSPARRATSSTRITATAARTTSSGCRSRRWTDPMANDDLLRPLNVLVFNASVSTNEDDLRSTRRGGHQRDGHDRRR